MSQTPTPIGLDRFQAEVGAWAEATFPLASDTTICIHLGREVAELRAWAAAPERTPVVLHVAEEAADCLLLLLHLAHRCGFSLLEAAHVKHVVNQSRQWGVPNAEGVVEHVEGEDQP